MKQVNLSDLQIIKLDLNRYGILSELKFKALCLIFPSLRKYEYNWMNARGSFSSIYYSLTAEERTNPSMLKEKSRLVRIAKGAGCKVEDVEQYYSFWKVANRFLQLKTKN